MKEKFFAFYNEDKYVRSIWSDNRTLFVFDTNILIDLYSLKDSEVDFFINILEKLEDRIWIPYHVGLEYNLNRLNAVRKRRLSIAKMKSEILNLNNLIEIKVDKRILSTVQSVVSLKKNYPNSYKLLEKLEGNLDETKEKIQKIISTKIENVVTEISNDFSETNGKILHVNSDDVIR